MTARLSIRARIAIFGSGVVALTLVLVGLLVYVLAFFGGANDRDRAIEARADETVGLLAIAEPTSFDPQRAPAPSEIEEADEIFVAILAEDGSTIVSTGEIAGEPPTVPAAALRSDPANGTTVTVDLAEGIEARIHVVPWSRPDLGRSGYVVAGQSTRRLTEDLNGILVFLVVAALIGLIAAFAANWRGAGRALHPLRSMARTADEIGGAEDLSRRLPSLPPRDEIGQLTASFNAMLARLEQIHSRLTETLSREQRFVADASHELRTPLTSIRTNADFLLAHPDADPADRRAAVTDIAAESDQMSRLVHDLLTLARADAGQPLERVHVDPLPLLADIVRLTRRLHPSREIALVREPGVTAGRTTVAGDPAALRRLVLILVDNALLHGGEAARVWLCLSASDGRTLLRVADDGPGIPTTDLDRVFARFFQVESSRSGGTGLGLAIARWIAEAHDGRVWACNNDGPGASFFVELPLAAVTEP